MCHTASPHSRHERLATCLAPPSHSSTRKQERLATCLAPAGRTSATGDVTPYRHAAYIRLRCAENLTYTVTTTLTGHKIKTSNKAYTKQHKAIFWIKIFWITKTKPFWSKSFWITKTKPHSKRFWIKIAKQQNSVLWIKSFWIKKTKANKQSKQQANNLKTAEYLHIKTTPSKESKRNIIMAEGMLSPRSELEQQSIKVTTLVRPPWIGTVMLNTVCEGCKTYAPWKFDKKCEQIGCPNPVDCLLYTSPSPRDQRG